MKTRYVEIRRIYSYFFRTYCAVESICLMLENYNKVVFFDNMKTVNWRRCRDLSQTWISTCLKRVTLHVNVAWVYTVSLKVTIQNSYRIKTDIWIYCLFQV